MELRHASQTPGYPPVLFVFRGPVEPGRAFFEKAWPEARAIADPTGALYDALGIPRGTFARLFGPAVFAAFFRGLRKGHGVGRGTTDPTREPGLFLVEGEQILWRHPFRHVGDLPDFRSISR